jgi:hypothetical protein
MDSIIGLCGVSGLRRGRNRFVRGKKRAFQGGSPLPHPADRPGRGQLRSGQRGLNSQGDFSPTLWESQYRGAWQTWRAVFAALRSVQRICSVACGPAARAPRSGETPRECLRQGQPRFLSGASAFRHKGSGTQAGIAIASRLDHARGSRDVAQERFHQSRAGAPVRPEKWHPITIASKRWKSSFEQIAIRF